jgi:hypothetical protein
MNQIRSILGMEPVKFYYGRLDALIQFHIDDDEVVRCQRFLKDRFEVFLACHAVAFGAVKLGQLGEIGDEKLGADDAAFVGFYLIALHAAVGVVAQNEDEDGDLMIGRGGELLLLHHE